jgi:SAM-dependent methyltransferase
LRRSLDYGLRGLPPPQPGRKRLLDVGCGNGAFLAVAAGHGWDVAGCDFDGVAVARARSLGFDVRHGGPEAFGPGERFDHVTLSHVVEHVHSPVKFLRDMRERMDPSARIFIDTPNADALGLERFGPNWRGLEAPRHLALFTWDGLERVLADAGFGRVVRHPQPQVSRGIWEKSAWIEAGLDPRDTGTDLPAGWNAGLPPDIAIDPWRTEFVTLTAARWA